MPVWNGTSVLFSIQTVLGAVFCWRCADEDSSQSEDYVSESVNSPRTGAASPSMCGATEEITGFVGNDQSPETEDDSFPCVPVNRDAASRDDVHKRTPQLEPKDGPNEGIAYPRWPAIKGSVKPADASVAPTNLFDGFSEEDSNVLQQLAKSLESPGRFSGDLETPERVERIRSAKLSSSLSDNLRHATKDCTEEGVFQKFHRRVLSGEIPPQVPRGHDSLRFCRVLSPFYVEGHGSGFLQQECCADGVQRWFLYTVRHNLAPFQTPPSEVPRLLLVVLDHGTNHNWAFGVRIVPTPFEKEEHLDFLRQELRDDNVTRNFRAIIQESEQWHRGLCTAIIEHLKCSRVHDREHLFGCAIGYSSTSAWLCLTYLWDRRPISRRVCSVLFVSFPGNSGGAAVKFVPDADGGHLEVDGVIEAGVHCDDTMKIDGWYVMLHDLEVNCITFAELERQRSSNGRAK